MRSVIRSNAVRRSVIVAVTASVSFAGVLSATQTAHALPPATDIRAAVRGADAAAYYMPGTQGAAPLTGAVYTSLGGGIIGVPAVVSVPPGGGALTLGTPYYIAVGLDHNLYVRGETGSWATLSPSPVYCASPAAATAVSAHAAGAMVLTVGCAGSDGALWYAQEEPAPPTGATLPVIANASWKSLGGSIIDGPAVASIPRATGFTSTQDDLTFFVNGLDGKVYWRSLTGSAWTPTTWQCVNHLAAASVNVSGTGPHAVFACEGLLDHYVHVWTTPGTTGWSAPTILGGTLGGMVLDGPGLAVGPGSWTVLAEGEDHALWEDTSVDAGITYAGWTPHGGFLTSGATGAALLFSADSP